jgi:peptidoglycan/xylan/chitin deacetylase (PgdA/CDA1 family)
VILTYHRVAPPGDDPLGLSVSPRRFRSQMRFLHRHGRPASMDEIARRPGPAGPSRVAVTFDDAYRGDLPGLTAGLRELGTPATVYVAPALLDSASSAWWETLVAILRHAGRNGYRLHTAQEGVSFDLSHAGTRRLCSRVLLDALRHMSDDDRRRCLAGLAGSCGLSEPPTPDPFLSWQDLAGLRKETGALVGSHTFAHRPAMPDNPAAFREELRLSRAALRAKAAVEARHFAYPSGSSAALIPAFQQILSEEGFATACSNARGVNAPDVSPHALRRISVGEEPLPVFIARVSGAL